MHWGVLVSSGGNSSRYRLTFWECVFDCSEDRCNGSISHPVELLQVGIHQGGETQAIVNDAEYHTLIQKEHVTLFNAFCSQCPSARTIRFGTWVLLIPLVFVCVKLESDASEAVRELSNFSIQSDSNHCHPCFFHNAPQGLCLAWNDCWLCYLTINVKLFPAVPEQQWLPSGSLRRRCRYAHHQKVQVLGLDHCRTAYFVYFVENRRKRWALWKPYCELPGHWDPVSESNNYLTILEWS